MQAAALVLCLAACLMGTASAFSIPAALIKTQAGWGRTSGLRMAEGDSQSKIKANIDLKFYNSQGEDRPQNHLAMYLCRGLGPSTAPRSSSFSRRSGAAPSSCRAWTPRTNPRRKDQAQGTSGDSPAPRISLTLALMHQHSDSKVCCRCSSIHLPFQRARGLQQG